MIKEKFHKTKHHNYFQKYNLLNRDILIFEKILNIQLKDKFSIFFITHIVPWYKKDSVDSIFFNNVRNKSQFIDHCIFFF